MITVSERITQQASPDATLTLPYESRQKSRQLVRLDNGQEAGLLLPRGTVLRNGDLLRAENGLVVAVHAATEEVSTVVTSDPTQLARVAYHLGNRHVPLEIGDGWLRYLHDHVLDGMVQALGLAVHCERAPFEPESGAYDSPAPHVHAHEH